MPIDLAAAAARFATAFATQLLNVTTAQQSIDKALAKRLQADRDVERASSRFPIVQFIDGAVTLRLTPAQAQVLTLDRPMAFGEQLAAGGLKFLDGLADATRPFRADSQETAIPRLLTGLDRMLTDIEGSVRRFSTPTPGMFHSGDRTGGDLFGLAALAFRVLAEAGGKDGQLRRFTAEAGAALSIVRPAPVAAGPDAGGGRSLSDALDAAAFELTAAFTVIGALPDFLTILLEGVDLRLRLTLLDELAGIEAEVLGLRRDAFDTMFTGMMQLADDGVWYGAAARQVLLINLSFQLTLWRLFGTELALGLRDFVIHLGDSLGAVVDLLRWVPKALAGITGIQLTKFASDGFFASLIDLKLDDLLDPAGTSVNRDLQAKMTFLVDVAEEKILNSKLGRIAGVFSETVRRARRSIPRARRLIAALFNSGGPGDRIPELIEAAPLKFHSDFPRLGDSTFGPSTALGLSNAARELFGALRSTVERAGERAAGGLTELADAFAADSARAARVQAGRGVLLAGGEANALAATMFGPEIEPARPADAVATAVERWFADGGILAVGAVIDGYVGELARYWQAQLTTGSELTAEVSPTSPHILRRRARLGRVTMPRLTLRAPAGAKLDEELAELLAGRFAGAIADAYRTGEQRLAELARSGGQ
jgi:hypothetical protein